MGIDIGLTVGNFSLSGGIERVTVALGQVYLRLGHRVTVYATDWDPAFASDFAFIRVPSPKQPAWLRTAILPAAVTRKLGKHDFVHAQGTSALRSDLLTFHSVHAAWCDAAQNALPRWSLRSLAKRFHPFHRLTVSTEQKQVDLHDGLIHACSQAVAQDVIRWYGAPPEKVVSLPWGVDTHLFQPNESARQALRTRYEIPPQAPTMLLVANEFARKGLAPLLRAMAEMNTSVHLLVAGRDAARPYQILAQTLNLAQRVHFLGSVASETVYPAADLFVLPSLYEGWGLVVAEALACGVPVVASRFPASEALIEPGQNGSLLDDPRNWRTLAESLDRAFEGTTLSRLKSRARPSILHSDWLAVGQQLIDLGLRGAALNRG